MNYVILHYFFMVHICYIKISGNTIRQNKKGEGYDIDDFINQLLTSQKFDELAEIVAEKAAYRIMKMDAATTHSERLSDANQINKTTENIPKYEDLSKRKSVKEFDKSLLNDINLRSDNRVEKKGKIDTQALLIDETTPQSENLRLKYKYFTRNTKKVSSNQTSEKSDQPVPKSDKNDDLSKQNEKTGPTDKFKDHDHDNKTEGHTSNQNVTDKNQYSPKELIDEKDNSRHVTRDDDHKDLDSNKNSKPHEDPHSAMNGERKKDSNKNDHPREEMSPRHEQTNSHEAQNSRPEIKSIVEKDKQEVGHADKRKSEEEENPSKLNEGNKENVQPFEEKTSEEKTAEEKTTEEKTAEEKTTEEKTAEKRETATEKTSNEELEKTEEVPEDVHEEEPVKSGTEENVQEDKESTVPHMRADYDDYPNVDENNVSLENNAYRSGYRYLVSDGNGDRTEEHTEYSEYQKMEEEEDPVSSTHKPIIRKEGEKLFTFVEGSEYEEYHEQVDKIRKENPGNPFDFV